MKPLKPPGASVWAKWNAVCGTALTSHTINVTMKRYRHLYPDARRAAASALDAYLSRADTGARIEQLEQGA